jgi:hypothetical protein
MNIILKRQCLCNTSDCAKCLGGNCVDDNCKIHTKEYKESRRQIQRATDQVFKVAGSYTADKTENKQIKYMSDKHDVERCKNGDSCPLCQVGLIVKEHNRKVRENQKSTWQEMKEDMLDTLRDLQEFTNRNVAFSFFIYIIFITLIVLLIYK